MPYIKQEKRNRLEKPLKELIEVLKSEREEKYGTVSPGWEEGELNYVIYTILLSCWKDLEAYSTANKLLGVLSAVEKEFYRRNVMRYEDHAIHRNGDIDAY